MARWDTVSTDSGTLDDGSETRVVSGGHGLSSDLGFADLPSLGGRRLDRYRLLDPIGHGGMGEVYGAYDPQLDRRVALKILRRDRGASDSAERMLREARALARLNHPNVVAIHDAGTVDPETLARIEDDEGDGAGLVFLAMEYVEGITLKQWLTGSRPLRERLEVLLAAGMGLAAAHEAGIVHRDFKPANVMIGDDGRVRVLDFGVARAMATAPAAPTADPSVPEELALASTDAPATQAGIVVGTLRYMAPEQMTGSPVDARTDQFAFCLVAHEALLGRRAFEGETMGELHDAMIEPPTVEGEGIPREVRDAIRQGLNLEPERRHRSMAALLTAFERTARPRSRSMLVFGSVTLLAAGAGLGAWAFEQPPPCAGSDHALDGAWDDGRRTALADAFASTELSFAEQTAQRTTEVLDRYAEAWREAHHDACEATHVQRTQSAALMDLRMTCLQRRRAELANTVALLVDEPDPTTVENALKAARSLSPLAPCADAEQLGAQTPLPSDPDARKAIEAGFEGQAEVRALIRTGKYPEAVPLGQARLESARALDYPPLTANAAIDLVSALEFAGQMIEARPVILEALRESGRAGDAGLQALALIAMAQHTGYRRGDEEAVEAHLELAEGLLERIGNPPEQTCRVLIARSVAALQSGRYAAGEALLREGLKLPMDSPMAKNLRHTMLTNLSAALGAQGKLDQAETIGQVAADFAESDLGELHPSTGVSYMNLGVTAVNTNRLEEGEKRYAKAEKILSAAFPNGHYQLAHLASNQAQMLKHQGKLDEARAMYERALRLKREMLGEREPTVAHTANNLADLLLAEGETERARALAQDALDIWRESLGREHPIAAYALLTLGEERMLARDYEAARAHFENALTLWKDAGQAPSTVAKAQSRIAYVLLRLGEDLDRARALAVESLPFAREDVTSEPDVIAALEAFVATEP